MLYDRTNVVFKKPELVKIEYNGAHIEVLPFLGIAQQTVLINKYIEEYFAKVEQSMIPYSEYNFLEAEYSLMNYIFQSNTNINADSKELDLETYVDVDLWEKITSTIVNYRSFRNKLDHTVNDIKEQIVIKSSVGSVIGGLVEKVTAILDKLPEMNPEEIKKLQEEGKVMLDRLEQSSVLKNPKDLEEEKTE